MSIAHERMNEIVSEVIKSIERNDTGIFPKSWVGGGLPKNYSSQTPYRGLNTLTLAERESLVQMLMPKRSVSPSYQVCSYVRIFR